MNFRPKSSVVDIRSSDSKHWWTGAKFCGLCPPNDKLFRTLLRHARSITHASQTFVSNFSDKQFKNAPINPRYVISFDF